jgi:hypothetical protein
VGDDLDDLRVAVAGLADREDLRRGDLAAVLGERFGELYRSRCPGVLARTGAVGFDLGGIEACLAADRGVRRDAVLAGVLLRQRQRDALARLRIEAAFTRDAMQAEEGAQRGGRVGEDLEEVGDHSELRLDRVQQLLLLGVGVLVRDDVDAAHGVSPVQVGLDVLRRARGAANGCTVSNSP